MRAVAWVLIALNVGILWYSHVAAYYVVDSLVYHKAARIFAETGEVSFRPLNEYQFVARMWTRLEDGSFVSKYPPLFSTLAAGLYMLGGLEGQLLLPLLCHLASLFAVYFLSLRLFKSDHAALAALLFVICLPAANDFALRQFSHGLSTTLFLNAFLFAVLSTQSSRASTSRVCACVSGVLAALIVTCRYGDVTYVPAIALAILWGTQRVGHTLAAFSFGFMLPIACMLAYNQSVFGGPLTTGYAATAEDSAFTLSHIKNNFWLYFRVFVEREVGPVSVLAVLAIARLGREKTIQAFALCAALALPALLYAAYYWRTEVGRFVVPSIVLLALLAGAELGVWFENKEEKTRTYTGFTVVCALLLALHMVWGVHTSKERIARHNSRKTQILEESRFLSSKLSEGDVLLTNKTRLLHYLDYFDRYELYHSMILSVGPLKRAIRVAGKERFGPKYALEKAQAKFFEKELADDKTFEKRISFLRSLVSRKDVFLLIPARAIPSFKKRYAPHFILKVAGGIGPKRKRYTLLRIANGSRFK